MTEDIDGINKDVEAALRAVLDVASRLKENIARLHATRRQAQDHDEREGVAPHAAPGSDQVMGHLAARDRAEADAERIRSASEQLEAHRLAAWADSEAARADEARASAQHDLDPQARAQAVHAAEQFDASADHARADGRIVYDSAERRAATARDLEARGIDREVIAARMRADVGQAKPATEAVKPGRFARTPRPGLAGRGRLVRRSGPGTGTGR